MKRRRVTDSERLLAGGVMPATTSLPHNCGYVAIRVAWCRSWGRKGRRK